MTHSYNTHDYWFNNTTVQTGGSNYKSERVFKGLVSSGLVSIPSEGKCVQMGVHTGITLHHFKKFFGENRTIGIDMYNINNDECVITADINTFTDNIPIAFAENDIGDCKVDPHTRFAAFEWAIANLVPSGVLITTSNLANDVFPRAVEDVCVEHNCEWHSLSEYNHMPWAIDMNDNSIWNTASMMMVIKK